MKSVPPWHRDERIAKAAVAYARLGFEVLPLYGIVDGACGCGNPECHSAGKHPWLDGGFHGASRDPATVAAWFQNKPSANVGIRPRSVGLVFDVDPKNGGDQAWDIWTREHGPCPDTVEVITGSGGRHFWLRSEPVKNTKLSGPLFGIDIISATGYVVAPPSLHISGDRYEWEGDFDLAEVDALAGDPFALAPEIWLKAVPETQASTNDAYSRRRQPTALMEPPLGELERVQQALSCIDARPYDDWITVGQALHAQCWTVGFELWDEWSQTAINYEGRSRTREKWSSFTIDGATGLGSLFNLAKGRLPLTPEKTTSPVAPPSSKKLLVALPELLTDIRKSAQLVEDLWPAGTIMMTFGQSGMGKTFWVLDGALHIAAGKQWMGRKVEQTPVVYVNGEGRLGFARRVKAWAVHHAVDVANIPFFTTTQSVALTQPEAVAELIEAAAPYAPGLVVVDTLARNFGGLNENDTQDMSVFLSNLEAIQRNLNDTTIMLVHHSGHQSKERARGNYGLVAAIDSEFRVERMESIIRVDNTKQRDMDLAETMRLFATSVEFEDAEGALVNSLVLEQTSLEIDQVEVSVGSSDEDTLTMLHVLEQRVAKRLADRGSVETPWVLKSELAEALKISRGTLKKRLQKLAEMKPSRIVSEREKVRTDPWFKTGNETGN